ncbi:MAG: FAD-dependent oxidoreductase [Granulosicoccaceae bacterium]
MVESSPDTDCETDIIIVGGGMVGTPLALLLAQQGWKVTLLDAADTSIPPTLHSKSLEQRCTAISAGSVSLLNAVGLWEAVKADACPITKVHVSQRGFFGTVRMQAGEHNLDALGFVVNNEQYLVALRSLLADSAVQHIAGARAMSYNASIDSATVGYKAEPGENSVTAKLVIAVDGVASAMRDAVGIGIRHHNYEQCAVLGCVELDQPHNNVAYERFAAGGPLAMLPRTGNIASFVFCIDAKHQKRFTAMQPDEFLATLQSEFGHRLGTFKQVGRRSIFPLTRIEAQVQQRDRLLLLGNAMRLVHPVAGQGYNLAIRDVAGLLNTLGTADVADPGNATLLAGFVNLRESDQNRIVKLTDVLARGFRGYSKLPGHIRGAGLLTMAAVPQLGQLITTQGLGYVQSAH